MSQSAYLVMDAPKPSLRDAWARSTLRSLVRDLFDAMYDKGAFDTAAQLAYWNLLAFFPFGIMALSLLAFIPLHGLDQQLIAFLAGVMPPEVAKLCEQVMQEVVGKQHGVLLVLALVGALWTASGSVSATMTALNQVRGLTETRSWIHTKLVAIGLTIAGSIMLVIATLAIALGTEVGSALFAGVVRTPIHCMTATIIRWVVVCGAMLGVSSLCYARLPNLDGKPHFVWPGAIFATVAWMIVSTGFAVYVAHFASYAHVYGALGAAIVLLTWLYLAGLVLLLGDVVNVHFGRAGRGQ